MLKMTKENSKEPKDLGIKIGTKEEIAWVDIRDGAIREMEQSKRMILIDEGIIRIAEERIAKEKKKPKEKLDYVG